MSGPANRTEEFPDKTREFPDKESVLDNPDTEDVLANVSGEICDNITSNCTGEDDSGGYFYKVSTNYRGP